MRLAARRSRASPRALFRTPVRPIVSCRRGGPPTSVIRASTCESVLSAFHFQWFISCGYFSFSFSTSLFLSRCFLLEAMWCQFGANMEPTWANSHQWRDVYFSFSFWSLFSAWSSVMPIWGHLTWFDLIRIFLQDFLRDFCVFLQSEILAHILAQKNFR